MNELMVNRYHRIFFMVSQLIIILVLFLILILILILPLLPFVQDHQNSQFHNHLLPTLIFHQDVKQLQDHFHQFKVLPHTHLHPYILMPYLYYPNSYVCLLMPLKVFVHLEFMNVYVYNT